ncbi:MAG: methyl-accepting chemotaxis protein [Bradyrhizobium sp.]
MFRLLQNLKIRTRIATALLIPVVGLLIISSFVLVQKWQLAGNMERLEELAGLANHFSRLVHEFQKERGISSLYLGSDGKQMGDALTQQRPLTDKPRRELDAFLARFDAARYDSEFGAEIKQAITMIGDLAGKRQQIDKLAMSSADALAYFTGPITQSLTAISRIALVSKDVGTSNAISAYVNFLYAKEMMGRERANGALGISGKKFSEEAYRRIVEITAEQGNYLANFKTYASSELKSFYAQTVVGNAVDEVALIRKNIFAGGLSGDLGGADGPSWFKMMTEKIDLMKKVEDRIADDLDALAKHESTKARTAYYATTAAVAALLAVTILLGTIIVRSIVRPMARMTDAMGRLAGGDKTIEINGTENRDEIGAMARAVVVFRESMIRADELAAKEAEAIKARERRARMMEELTGSFDLDVSNVLKTVVSAATELHSTAAAMTDTAEESNRQATSVAAATEQTTVSVQTIATSAEELSSSISEISRQVTHSASVAQKAVAETAHTDSTMQGLAESAQRIGEVVKLIQEIASQTNLLALNATIEAARAGEAGRGFAVVASEVKALAGQTAKATEDITSQISSIQSASSQAVQAIRGISGTIREISEISTTIASAVEEQGAATQEIARNVQQAANGSQEVAGNLRGVTQAANDTGAAAHQVLASSEELSKQSETLRMRVETFLHGVKAA